MRVISAVLMMITVLGIEALAEDQGGQAERQRAALLAARRDRKYAQKRMGKNERRAYEFEADLKKKYFDLAMRAFDVGIRFEMPQLPKIIQDKMRLSRYQAGTLSPRDMDVYEREKFAPYKIILARVAVREKRLAKGIRPADILLAGPLRVANPKDRDFARRQAAIDRHLLAGEIAREEGMSIDDAMQTEKFRRAGPLQGGDGLIGDAGSPLE